MSTPTNGTAANAVSVLTAFKETTGKTYYINDKGELDEIAYGNEFLYFCRVVPITSIQELAALVTQLSTGNNKIIIRGQPKVSGRGPFRRTHENYDEPGAGLFWAMLDFDKIPLPEGLSPASLDAIEWLIRKLPVPFHNASYFYQFSSSTGIFRPDGTPRKPGLNVHLFFWFSRPITGNLLKAYLTGHCIEADFLYRGHDKAGSPRISYGVDMALFNAVQPHYIAAPTIKEEVTRTLDEENRQGLVEKAVHAVVLPELQPELIWNVQRERHRVLNEHKRACGWVKAKSLAKAKGVGVAISEYYRNPNPAAVKTGRQLVDVKVTLSEQEHNGSPVQFARLYFVDESSPGSWYVKSTNPTTARKYGDGESIHLHELSLGAYEYVSDTLGWFREISTNYLQLNSAGFLPEISSFATAKNCLILAPTGAGKTTAFCRFAKANQDKIIIYAAQTIALTRQMEADLRAANVPACHYRDFSRNLIHPGVFITTNKSLGRIVEAIIQHGADYWLVIDEAHIALDDFMKTDKGNRLLERAMTRAARTLFMTATLTDVQLKKLTELVSITDGEMTSEKFGYYQFQPRKQNPLWWATMANFWRDFVALLRHYKSLKDDGQDIPRTIIIAPTSQLEPFRILLGRFDLTDQAKVVSRLESVNDEIEGARVGTQPILISSPLFALGLNFDSLPVIFWTYFGHLQVDESQIIQTVNRANRDADLCEVRLYAGSLDASPYRIPDETKEKLRIGDYFGEEASLEGLLDSHFQIDRLTYQELRDGEKATAKALYRLKADNAIQNYTIVDEWDEWLGPTEDDEKIAKSAVASARTQYDEDILDLLATHDGWNQAELLSLMDKNYRESKDFRNEQRLQKGFKDNEIALSMALAKIDDVGVGKKMEAVRLRRLFGDVMVFMSSQFQPGRYRRWMEVAAAKTLELLPLVLQLENLKNRGIDGAEFGWAMRKKGVRSALLASANSDRDYIKLEKHLDNLDEYYEEYRQKAGDSRREKLNSLAFAFARSYLETIGIDFNKVKGADGYIRFDPKQPMVPDWNFTAMAHRLIVKAGQYLVLPKAPSDKESEPLRWLEQEKQHQDYDWGHIYVSNALCRQCKFCEPHFICALGRGIQPDWGGYVASTDKCDAFKKVPTNAKDRLDLPASK